MIATFGYAQPGNLGSKLDKALNSAENFAAEKARKEKAMKDNANTFESTLSNLQRDSVAAHNRFNGDSVSLEAKLDQLKKLTEFVGRQLPENIRGELTEIPSEVEKERDKALKIDKEDAEIKSSWSTYNDSKQKGLHLEKLTEIAGIGDNSDTIQNLKGYMEWVIVCFNEKEVLSKKARELESLIGQVNKAIESITKLQKQFGIKDANADTSLAGMSKAIQEKRIMDSLLTAKDLEKSRLFREVSEKHAAFAKTALTLEKYSADTVKLVRDQLRDLEPKMRKQFGQDTAQMAKFKRINQFATQFEALVAAEVDRAKTGQPTKIKEVEERVAFILKKYEEHKKAVPPRAFAFFQQKLKEVHIRLHFLEKLRSAHRDLGAMQQLFKK